MPSLDILIPAFNAEQCLPRTLEAVFAQTKPPDMQLGVIVINNRSTDGTPAMIDAWSDKGVRRLDYLDAQGRVHARNAGIAASQADYLLLLDADCQLVGPNCLDLIAATMARGVDAGFGYATGLADDFWSRYFRQLEAERVAAGWRGWTSQVVLIKRDFIQSVGGFRIDYTHYGFEDRDLICRLRAAGNARSLESLTALRVVHDDDTNAAGIFEKMYIAGRYSSGIFKANFPTEYLATVYAKVDIDTASASMLLALRLLRPVQSLLNNIAEFLSRHRTPLVLGRPFIKLCSALSYHRGTVERNTRL